MSALAAFLIHDLRGGFCVVGFWIALYAVARLMTGRTAR